MKGNGVEPSVIRLRRRTLYFVLIVIIGVFVAVSVFLPVRDSQENITRSFPAVASQAPDFTLKAFDGAEISLLQFHSQPVLVNFWASWCVPCREEMPELVRAYEAYKAEGFVILGLNLTYSDSVPDVQAFANEFNITFPVLLDEDGEVAERLYRIPGIPTSIFVNRDGTIQRVQVGVMTGEQIKKYITEILK